MDTTQSLPLANQVAVVTGAGRGIGHAIALRLARDGARVAVVSRSETNARRTADEINATQPSGGESMAYAADVSEPSAISAVGQQILKDFEKVDILVNNAGVTRDGLSMRMSEGDWDVVLDTNLKGAFFFIQAFQRNMLRLRKGRIINISSVSGLTGNAGQSNYAASKAGLIGLTKSLARELASRAITVNAVAPGFIVTDMTESLPAEAKKKVTENIPLGRFGQVDDIAAAVAFLASPAANYITGQVLTRHAPLGLGHWSLSAMMLYLLRHADAQPANTSDAARELTAKGWEQARTVAAFCERKAIRPALILTSPFRRTVQTAEIVAEKLKIEGGAQTEPFLESGMDPETALAELQAFGWAQSLLVVGHEPDLGMLATTLLGLTDAGALPFEKASLVGLRVERLAPYAARLEFAVPVGMM